MSQFETRGDEMPILTKKPSEVFRESSILVSLEADEPLLAETIDSVGAEHLVFASDIPHWDGEFPGNLNHLRAAKALSGEVKEKILYSNARAFVRM